MKKNITLIALALACTLGLTTSCSKDEKEDTSEKQPSIEVKANAYTGWTSATHIPPTGGQAFFTDFHAAGETATVAYTFDKDNRMTIAYSSTAWGVATFENLEVKAENGRYILPAGAVTDIAMQRGAYGGNGGGVYQLTLESGSISANASDVSLVMSAFMSERHGSYRLTFHEGDAPQPVVQ